MGGLVEGHAAVETRGGERRGRSGDSRSARPRDGRWRSTFQRSGVVDPGLDVTQVVGVDGVSDRGVHGGASWPSAREHLAGAVFERLRRLVQRDVAADLDAADEDEGEGHGQGHRGEQGPGHGGGERPRAHPTPPPAPGEGVSPAASAAASGSPPGRAAATASAECGRCRGSGSRQCRIARSTAGSISPTICDGFTGVAFVVLPRDLGQRPPRERLLAGEQLVEHQPQRVDVAGRASPRARRAAPATCRRACPSGPRRPGCSWPGRPGRSR